MIIYKQIKGFTLVEMVLVIVIIGIISTIAMKSLQTSTEQARFEATVTEMDELARAIVGNERLVSGGVRSDFGYVGDVGSLPTNLDALLANPGGYSTWKGPYFRVDFNENTGGYQRDAWNELYIYAGGITIVSNGGGSAITKQFANTGAYLTANTITGMVRDIDLAPPGDSASNVTVTIQYPDGAGSMTVSSISPSASGEFSFSGVIPIGIHQVQATTNSDTVSRHVVVYPGKTAYTEIRFARDLW